MSASSASVTNSIPPDSPKPLAGKYDKRCLSPKQLAARAPRKQYGRKPAWLKHLDRNSAFTILKELNDKQAWQELYLDSVRANDRQMRFQILRYLTDRRDGRPFVAENPNARAGNRTPDPNLVIAVNNLTVNNASKSKKKHAVIDSQAISTQSAGDLPQLPAADSGAVPAVVEPIQAAKNRGDGERK